MKELVFSIKEIFNDDSQEDCLVQYDCKGYHIPAYQRGYKWSSEPNGAVEVLLNDLWEAFLAYKKKERKEYYLQYITVKKIQVNQHSVLEVIDGQQRLTTLSILLSVMSTILDKENISADKLDYAIRENFFKNHIYQKNNLDNLVNQEWEILKQNPELNKQDVYYMFSAAKKIYSFIKDKENRDKESFNNYLLEYVKLIVNSVESHVESETVFKNLNSNKVPLTEAELIKGLLITKVGRGNQKKEKKHFKEILEVRLNLGRHWDEISNWANQPQIKTFFFNNKDGMEQLLTLTALSLENATNKVSKNAGSKDFPLFNFFHKYPDPSKIYQTLKDNQAILNDWFCNDKIYNLLGYCRFVKGSNNNTHDFLLRFLLTNKDELVAFLEEEKNKLLPSREETLLYGENDNAIHAALLAMSVFVDGQKTRFNFHNFITENWTLEHIFPQSPEGKNATLEDSHKNAIRSMLEGKISETIEEILNKDSRTEDERKIYYDALKNLSQLNSIGNMCLLTSSDNSSNGCKFFLEKRENIMKLIQKGSFVPKHTFDVFSKMIPGLENSEISVWDKNDIENHLNYIQQTLPSKITQNESREI